MPLTLDAQGAARVTVPNLPALKAPAMLTAELEYADANGELLTTSNRIRLVPSAAERRRAHGWLGLQQGSRALPRRRARYQRQAGRRHAGERFAVHVGELLVSQATHRRLLHLRELAGEHEARAHVLGQDQRAGSACCARSRLESQGQVLLRAEARDAGGNVAGATTSVWVAGTDDWWFGGTAADRMDVLPENPEYESGETARFQVRMPFRSARALVTVEREGVMRSYVTTLSGREPVVKVPIEAADSPNVYVSVLALRGRVGEVAGAKSTTARRSPRWSISTSRRIGSASGTSASAGSRIAWM